MEKKLTILVSGPPMSGRSTIMYILERFFLENGFDVNISMVDNLDFKSIDDFHRITGVDINEKIEAIRSFTEITLKETQTNRETWKTENDQT